MCVCVCVCETEQCREGARNVDGHRSDGILAVCEYVYLKLGRVRGRGGSIMTRAGKRRKDVGKSALGASRSSRSRCCLRFQEIE